MQKDLLISLLNDGEYDKAADLIHETIQTSEETLGKDHPQIARLLSNLGFLHKSQGNYAEAQIHYKRALTINKSAHGDNHPQVATDVAIQQSLAMPFEQRSHL